MNLLNPWVIETENRSNQTIRIRLRCLNNGEIMQIDLSVDDISNINIVGKSRIRKAAEMVDKNATIDLDKLLGVHEDDQIVKEVPNEW